MKKMFKPNKFFYKFLCVSLMFFCFNTTYAGDTVCGSGYYVASCSNEEIGTNLLKGFKYTENDVAFNSPNYYDYSNQSNMDNLRNFFKGRGTLTYQDYRYNEHTVTASEYTEYRRKFLQKYCPNKNSILCLKCPNGGKTGVSTIDTSVSDPDSKWTLQVISDCYVSKFTDSTGSYEYIANTSQSGDKVHCYYDIDKPGTQFIPNSELNPQTGQNVEEQETNSSGI